MALARNYVETLLPSGREEKKKQEHFFPFPYFLSMCVSLGLASVDVACGELFLSLDAELLFSISTVTFDE